MFKTVQPGKEYTLVRNPNWVPATDPVRKALPDEIDVQLKQNAGRHRQPAASPATLDVDVAGTGVRRAALGKILADPKLKAQLGQPASASGTGTLSVNPDVAPLNNLDCRQAVQYATNKASIQRAYGGNTGGAIATNMLPPTVPGAQQFNTYPPGPDNTGDLQKAKDALSKCGQPTRSRSASRLLRDA